MNSIMMNSAKRAMQTRTKPSLDDVRFDLGNPDKPSNKALGNLLSATLIAFQKRGMTSAEKPEVILKKIIFEILEKSERGDIQDISPATFKTIFPPAMKALSKLCLPENAGKEQKIKGNPDDKVTFFIKATPDLTNSATMYYLSPDRKGQVPMLDIPLPDNTSSDHGRNQLSADVIPEKKPAVADQQSLVEHRMRGQLIQKELDQKQKESEQRKQVQLPIENRSEQVQKELIKPLLQPAQVLHSQPKVTEQNSSARPTTQKTGLQQSPVVQQKPQFSSGQSPSDLLSGHTPAIPQRSSSSHKQQKQQNSPVQHPVTVPAAPSPVNTPEHGQKVSLPSQLPQQPLSSPAQVNLQPAYSGYSPANQPGYPSANQVQMNSQMAQQHYLQMPLNQSQNQSQYNLQAAYPSPYQAPVNQQGPSYVQVPYQVQPAMQQVQMHYAQQPAPPQYYVVQQPMYPQQNQVQPGFPQPIQYVQAPASQIPVVTQQYQYYGRQF